MPEYLAPGVYVEETSFRSKSIEGVGTSTAAFVGPTLKGPVDVTPELITSFGDFERVYGGFASLDLTLSAAERHKNVNYMAHAVRAFFDNGGSRLYVSRVVPLEARAAESQDLISSPAAEVRFVARFPGKGSGGEVLVFQQATPVNATTIHNAPVGSLVRTGGANPEAAIVTGTVRAPFAVDNARRLVLRVNGGGDVAITFFGQTAEVISSLPLEPTINTTTAPTVTVRVGQDGVDQVIELPIGPAIARQAIVDALNSKLKGATARLLTGGDAANENRLAIATTVQGKSAWIRVLPNAPLHFATTTIGTANPNPANNNVNDLSKVTPAEMNALLQAASPAIPVRAELSKGMLVLSTIATGSTASLAVQTATDSAHTALGLAVGTQTGRAPNYYVKAAADQQLTDWVDSGGTALASLTAGASVLTFSVVARDQSGSEVIYEELGLDSRHPRWIGQVLAMQPPRRADALANPFALDFNGDSVTALTLRSSLLTTPPTDSLESAEPFGRFEIRGGTTGSEPTAEDYRPAFKALEALEDISIVAAPGHSAYDEFEAIQDVLITHVSRRRAYQIAVLDTPPGRTLNEARGVRSRIDTSRAALYYPWVIVPNPLARPTNTEPAEIAVPPSGFVCGIYARNDTERGVSKAPANEVVRGVLRFEVDINFAQQEVLNPLGVNCLRFFPGRGYRLWGARTTSSDPEWKYVNVRRYFNYLEASIDRSTQWAVFESNNEQLWVNIQDTITGFLYNEWVSGALLGSTPQEAFFVRCDRSTMTQNDLDNGRLICLIGIAVVKPAEFVIFRIGQKTADARV